jgi:hypothetical protein
MAETSRDPSTPDGASPREDASAQIVDDDMGIPRPLAEPSAKSSGSGDPEHPSPAVVPPHQHETVDRPVDPLHK